MRQTLNAGPSAGAALLMIALCAGSLRGEEPARRPNLLILMADDMGYGDAGCSGCQDYETPHIDSIAAAGITCTQAMSRPRSAHRVVPG